MNGNGGSLIEREKPFYTGKKICRKSPMSNPSKKAEARLSLTADTTRFHGKSVNESDDALIPSPSQSNESQPLRMGVAATKAEALT